MILAEDGFSSEQLFAQSGLPISPRLMTQPVALAELPNLLEAAFNMTHDSALMIRLGQRTDITHLGTFGFALMSCATVHEALKLLLRYQSITGLGLSFRTLEAADNIVLRTNIAIGNPLHKKLITELVMSQIIRIGQTLTSQAINQSTAHFIYDQPNDLPTYEKILKVPVVFNQTHNEIIISKRIINSEIMSSNPAAHVIYQQQCEHLLRELNRVENFSAAIRRILIHASGEFPDINHVAKTLYVSESTLRRRLSNESTNFRVICDEVKNVLARQYLNATKLTIAEIASLLDYSEPVSFRRAFIRWNHMTPSEYRHDHSVPKQDY
tara:strand:+ start:6531 stop:7505 length:975 start_codon:yes stop_codon:yes gene_type:complete